MDSDKALIEAAESGKLFNHLEIQTIDQNICRLNC